MATLTYLVSLGQFNKNSISFLSFLDFLPFSISLPSFLSEEYAFNLLEDDLVICALHPFASCLFPDLPHLVSCMFHFHSPLPLTLPIKVIGDFCIKEPQASSASCLVILLEKVAHHFLIISYSSNGCSLVPTSITIIKLLS